MQLVLFLTGVSNTASLEFNVYNIYDGSTGPKVGVEISSSILSQVLSSPDNNEILTPGNCYQHSAAVICKVQMTARCLIENQIHQTCWPDWD